MSESDALTHWDPRAKVTNINVENKMSCTESGVLLTLSWCYHSRDIRSSTSTGMSIICQLFFIHFNHNSNYHTTKTSSPLIPCRFGFGSVFQEKSGFWCF